MNITIINGTPEKGWHEYEQRLIKAVEKLSAEHSVSLFTVRDMDINYCRGCFGCWTKTPGLCFFRDGMDEILGEFPYTDFLIFVSPLKTGFITSETKKIMGRMLPTVLPYIKLFDGECHHPKRYDNDPVLGLLIYDDNPDERAVEITFSILDRYSLNFRGRRTFKKLVKPETIQEVLENEISNY